MKGAAMPRPRILIAEDNPQGLEIGRAHVELQSHHDLVCRLLLEKKKCRLNAASLRCNSVQKSHSNNNLKCSYEIFESGVDRRRRRADRFLCEWSDILRCGSVDFNTEFGSE